MARRLHYAMMEELWGCDNMVKLLSRIAIAAYGLIVTLPFAFAGNPNGFCPHGTILVDDVCEPIVITTAVSEPATIALLAAGAGALAFARFRRRK